MKKTILVLVCALWPVLAAFSGDNPFSAGVGGLVGLDINRYTFTSRTLSIGQDNTQVNYGGFVFLDARWAEIAVSVQGGSGRYAESMEAGYFVLPPLAGAGRETVFGFSLFGKYPFGLSSGLSVFPMIGLEYRVALAEKRREDGLSWRSRNNGASGGSGWDLDKNGRPYSLSAWNALWLHIGAGADFYFRDNFFLRGEFLYGFRLRTKYEEGFMDMVTDIILPQTDQNLRRTGLTSGPVLKIAAGYKFR